MGVSFSSSKPIGSVHKPKTIHVADLPPVNADHVGGYKVAAATFAGIEHKFGLALPKFNTSGISTYVPLDASGNIANGSVTSGNIANGAVSSIETGSNGTDSEITVQAATSNQSSTNSE